MIYASCLDLEIRFGVQELQSLGARGDVTADAAAQAALDDAAAEIDTALATTYDLPLPPAHYPALTGIAASLARARLYTDVAPEVVTERARGARAALRRIGTGVDALVDADGMTMVPRAESSFSAPAGPLPVMTPEALRGF